MRKLLLFILLICGVANAQRVHELANKSSLGSNDLFSVSQGGAGSRNISMGQLRADIVGGIDVRTFGADPSGVTACGTNIQRAIDLACLNGKEVILPEGSFRLGNHLPHGTTLWTAEGFPCALTVWSNNVTIRGAGKDKTRIYFGDTLTSLRNMIGAPSHKSGAAYSGTGITNLVLEGITFDAENKGTGDLLYDTTQFYYVYGDGITFRDCAFINNLENDGIDVQFGTDMRVENCVIKNNGGDGIGVQNRNSFVSDTYIENCRQEGLEFVDQNTFLNNVVVSGCNNIATIDSQNFFASQCELQGTNNADSLIRIGKDAGCANLVFDNVTIKSTPSSGPAVVLVYGVGYRTAVFEDVLWQVSGTRDYLLATNGSHIAFRNNRFGDYTRNSASGLITLNGGRNFEFTRNEGYPRGNVGVLLTNGAIDFELLDNRDIGAVTVHNGTNGLISGNSFSLLAVTNSAFVDIMGSRGNLALSGGSTNMFSANVWLSAPAGDYWTQDLISGDVVTNKLFFGRVRHGTVTAGGENLSLRMGNAFSGINSDKDGYINLVAANTSGGGGVWSISGVSGDLYNDRGSGRLWCNVVALASGTASAPAHSFGVSGDTDTGMFRHSENNLGFTSGGTEKFRVTPTGMRLISPTVPASASDTGTAGDIAWDASYIYICVGANTWERTALATW